MSPPYLFRVDEIGESPDAPHILTNQGQWMPSTDVGANIRKAEGASGRWWFCNGQQIYENPSGLPSGSLFYKNCSMYYGAGIGIWIMTRDATTLTDQDWECWRLLTFDHNPHDYSSYLTNAGQSSTLRVQRNDQRWPQLLLPDIYRTEVRTEAPQYGGLTGELPIFLGLVALSTSRTYVASAIRQSFQNGAWHVHQYAQPRQHQRGVVVSVYTCPPSWSGGSTRADLGTYESGGLGKYFN